MPRCRGKAKSTGKRCKIEVADGHWCEHHDPETTFSEMDENGRMTQAAFARLIDRSAERVRQYREKGILELEDDGKLDVEKSIEAIITHGDLSRGSLPFRLYEKHVGPLPAGGSSGDDEEDESLQHQLLVAKVQRTAQMARKAKLQADEIEAKLIPLEEVERQWFEICRQTRDKILTVPDRVAGELAGLTDDRAVYETLTRELHDALVDLADDLEELAAA